MFWRPPAYPKQFLAAARQDAAALDLPRHQFHDLRGGHVRTVKHDRPGRPAQRSHRARTIPAVPLLYFARYLLERDILSAFGQITQALFEVGGQYRRNM